VASSKHLLPEGKQMKAPTARGRPRCFDLEKALDRSMMLFWQKGFRETSLDEIAQAIGVKKPSLYAAFGDKEMLFRKVIERYSEKFGQPEMHALQDNDDIYLALDAFFDRGIAYASGRRTPRGCLLATAFAECALLPMPVALKVKALIRQGDQVMAKRLEKAVRCGQLPPEFDVMSSAKFLMSVMHALALRARAGETRANLHSLKRAALRCLRSVLPGPSIHP
jgi:AcrR family transcriptional regulator